MRRNAAWGFIVGIAALCTLVSVRGGLFGQEKETPGRKLALLVGVRRYDHQDLKDLDFPENDVEDLAAVLKEQHFETVVLTTARGKDDGKDKPTAANIRARLKGLLVAVNKHDLIMVALAGHGIQPLGSDESYFCPMDANPVVRNDKPIAPERLVSVGEILGQMTDSGIGEKLLLVDACRNDPSARGARRRGVDHVNVAALPDRTGVLLSCSQGEFSFEEKSLGRGHGVFFYHVIEGLKGAARDADGQITWDELAVYVRSKVPPTVQKLFGKDGGEQSPNSIGNLRGLPTVLTIARIVTPSERPSPPPAQRLGARMTIPESIRPTPIPAEPEPQPEPPPETADAWAGKVAGQKRSDNGLKTALVWCPPGSFLMGSPPDDKDRDNNEDQARVRFTRGFWLGQCEVTQIEWRRVMRTKPWKVSYAAQMVEGDNYPAVYVTYDNAIKFCETLTDIEHRAGRLPPQWMYTLPTEAQWEYACRAGSTTRFSFGDNEAELGEYAWWGGYGEGNAKPEPYAHPVGQKKPNAWDLYDMHGNVWEQCYGFLSKQPAGGTNPQGPSRGSARIHRGGAWTEGPATCRSAYRPGPGPAETSFDTGFRMAAVLSGK